MTGQIRQDREWRLLSYKTSSSREVRYSEGTNMHLLITWTNFVPRLGGWTAHTDDHVSNDRKPHKPTVVKVDENRVWATREEAQESVDAAIRAVLETAPDPVPGL